MLLMILLGFSCTDLDIKLTDEWSDEDTWENADMAEGVLNSVYKDLWSSADSYDNNFLDAATDNALTRNYDSKVYRAGQGAFSYSSNPLGIWSNTYKMMQNIHMFMERGLSDNVSYEITDPTIDAKIKNRLRGEAHFLRAYCGFLLLQMYGGKVGNGDEVLGYPIVTTFIETDEAAQTEKYIRNTYEECVEQIVSDCEEAFERLPLTYTGSDAYVGSLQIGRANGLAAAALKARVLVYAASPAYQPNSIVKLNGMGDYTIVNESAYKAKWERAALYANEVLALVGEYKALNMKDLYDATDPEEFIFRVHVGNNRSMEERHYPPYYYGSANTIPSHNLAMAFPAKNGFPVTDTRSGYDPTNPYSIERDKRFEQNLFYHGKKFGNNDSYIDVTPEGKDGGYFSVNASRSGYYLSKFINTEKANMLLPNNQQNSRHYNPLLRKGEVWLNYAEAAFEAWGAQGMGEGCSYSAYDVIKTIREKSGGITDVTYLDEAANDENKFRALLQNERRIEMTFENQRFWDIRRWLLPLNETMQGMSVTRNGMGDVTYQAVDLEERPMNDIRYYYLPLPYDELKKNSKLVNNMGWEH